MPQRFGEKLRQIRRQQGLTQTALAERVGTASRAHISNLETGREVPSLAVAVGLAEHLGVTTDSLLRDDREVEALDTPGVAPAPDLNGPLPIGVRLRALRRARHLQQWRLAQELQLVSRAYLSDLETGHKLPSIDLVIRIADFFHVTTDSLLRSDWPAGANASIVAPAEGPGPSSS